MSGAVSAGAVLAAVRDEGSGHAAQIAETANASISTVRRRLQDLEDAGLVRGVKHDERRIVHGGRIRVYWALTEAGERELQRRVTASLSEEGRS